MLSTVADVMTREVVTVGPEASFRDVVRLIEDRHVDALPVVDGAGKIVGIIDESDLLLKEEFADGPHGQSGLPWQRRRDRFRASATTVQQAMSRHVVTVESGATLTAAARLMHRNHVSGLPVVGADSRLEGIVTRSDLLRVFLGEDVDLCAAVHAALGPVAARGVSCSVTDGRVRLEGEVQLRSQAMAATAMARRVPGVVDVDSRLLHYAADDVQVSMVGP